MAGAVRRAWLATAHLVALVLPLSPLPATCDQARAAGPTPTAAPAVFVGGTLGAETLASAETTRRLRATGRVGLYLHELGTEVMARAGVSAEVAALFAGPSVAEFGLPERDAAYSHVDAVNFFNQPFPRLFSSVGFHPFAANVNGLDPTGAHDTLADWEDYRVVAGQGGVTSLAPFADPNGTAWPLVFDDPFWDYFRSVCLAVGGMAVDSPPGFFWQQSEAYRHHDVEKVRWAVAQGLRVSVVISPWGRAEDFLGDTRRFVAYLGANGALPTEWVVETYDDPARPRMPGNPLGSEEEAGTVDSVALWVAGNAGVAGR